MSKAIPKKIRGMAWENAFGQKTNGNCYCCEKLLNAFDTWHAGHIISRANGGTDTVENLRPLCPSCNLSMKEQNMDDWKKNFYPSKIQLKSVTQKKELTWNGLKIVGGI